ncbi:kinesin-like protein KIN-12D isoform X2 [Physcomitrium patens]|uniref:kinesin-like protein KIN-12D isoform X2 n=1 Tax=Physcomitrium patens TaxID=3218 RepID=UPI00024AFACB|nr:kinesin-like protein KIN-12E isoform X2 [Physcomitrium patens]|eukprot:XP_024397560.1 kinesin-like protein KIN-12E isoform X2 [Physcomitrella patens]
MNPLRLFSKVASTSPKKLSFDVCDGLGPARADSSHSSFVVTTRGDPNPSDMIASADLLSLEVECSREGSIVLPPATTDFDASPPRIDRVTRGARKHGQILALEPGCTEGASPVAVKTESSRVPTPGRGKKTALTQGRGLQAYGSTNGKSSHHRRSLSNTPRSDNNSTTSTESSIAPATRTLRQSASFSGTTTPRGGRPPTNAELNTPLLGSAGTAPRSAGKWAKCGVNAAAGTRLPKALGQHEEEPDRTERVEDPTFWMDHSVQVLIRARPISSAEIAQQGIARCVKQENAHTISWLGQPETRFTFDHVAGEFVTQEELFRVAGLPMVENCMAGYNSCMFAYGQTGSGKTHTMLGDIGDFDQQPNENCGMTPRVFAYLFAKIQKEEEAQKHRKLKYKCRCSFLEIYNEQISDLLEPSLTNLQMREDLNKGVYVEGLLEVEVQNVQDVLHLLLLGATNRKVAATNMNKESSRSHSVFTCIIESQWECDSMINFRYGRLNLVDLAGSERQKATGEDGERLREAASINKSLSTLGLVIMVLVDIANGKQRHVPYRDSKLTFLLQDSLGGNSKTTIIANISPSSCAASETLSTLKFAQRAKFIQNNAVINEQSTGNVKELQEQIQQLKDELARIRRQSISRIPSMPVVEDDNATDMSNESGFDPMRSFTEGSFLQFGRAVLGPTALNQKIKELEDLLAAALRREKILQKTSAAEIQDLTRLVDRNTNSESAAIVQETSIAELSSERRATELLRYEVESCQRDLADYRVKLQISLESNERMTSELDALRKELENSQEECRMQKHKLGILQGKVQQFDCLELKQAQHEQFMFELKTQLQKSEERAAYEMKRQRQLEHRLQEELQESTNLHAELQSTRASLKEAEALVETLRGRGSGLEIGDSEASYESAMIKQLRNEITELNKRLEDERDRGRELENQVGNKAARDFVHEPNHKSNIHTECPDITGRKRVRHHDAILQLQMELESIDGGSPGRSDPIKGYRWESGTVDEEVEVKHTMTIMQLQLDMEALESVLAEERRNLAEARSSSELLRQEFEETKVKLNAEKSKVEALTRNQYLKKVEGQLHEAENEEMQLVKMQEALLVTKEHFNLEMQTLVAAVAEAEKRYVSVKKELESIHYQFQGLADRTRDVESRELVVQADSKKLEELKKHLGAVHILSDDLPNQIEMTLEGSVNVKDQTIQEPEDWVLEKSDLLLAVRDFEARCMEKDYVIGNLKKKIASLNNGALESVEVVGLRSLSRNETMVMLEKNLENMAQAMVQITTENIQLQRDIELLRKDSDSARRLVEQKEEELTMAQRKLADTEDLMEQETFKIEAISLLITEAGSSEASWVAAREILTSMISGLQSYVGYSSGEAELELARTQILLAGSEGKVRLLSEMVVRMQSSRSETFETELEFDLVKSADRPLRRLSENRSRISSSDSKINNTKLVEKLRQGLAKTKAENAKLISEVREKENATLSFWMQLSSAEAKCTEMEVIAASKEKKLCHQLNSLTEKLQNVENEAKNYKSLAQKSEAELERLTMLLLDTEERQRQAEQAWVKEKTELQSQRHEAQLEAATKKLKLPARFAKLDKWQQRLSEADQLINMLVEANEKLRQECSQRSMEAEMTNNLILELLETVALSREQLHATMSHTEREFRALIEESHLLKAHFKSDIMRLRETQLIVVDDMMRSIETLPSVKCLESERRSWELQCKAANAVLAEKELTIRNLQTEVAKAVKQMWCVQTEKVSAVEASQEKEETIVKHLNEVNHLKESADRDMSLLQSITEFGGYHTPLKQPMELGLGTPLNQNALRQSVTKEAELGHTPLRRSFSCKLIEEKEMTLNVLKEEQEYLKTMVFSLDTEKSELQQQLLDLEADATALRSTIANLERELHDSNRRRCEDVDALVEQLQESTRHICDLEVQRTDLREEMQRQAVLFAELYEQLQKQESLAEAERANEGRADENKYVLQMLEQEKAELKTMVERLDTEIMAHQVESKQLKTQVEALKSDLALKTVETVRINEELDQLRGVVEFSERETKILRDLVEDFKSSRSRLEEQLQYSTDASILKVEQLEAERDKFQDDLHLFMGQLEEIQKLADQRDIAASEARQVAELNKIRAEEKQVEVDILGKSVEELENTVYALESQVGLLKRECERQRLMREEMESEIQGLKNQISIMHAALHEASTRSSDERLETKIRRENAESMLEEREAELQLLRKKLEKLEMQLEESKPVEWVQALPPAQIPIQKGQKLPKGAASAFACIKLNHQVHLELDEERKAYERRIQELEDVLGSHQNEVTTLHGKLADAERMTRDVLHVLRCIKLDMSNVATLLDEQQVEEGVKSDRQTLQKDEEIEQILTQLNDFIEERESWLEMISRKQLELLAAQESVENLREREKALVAENKKLVTDNRNQLKKIGHLEQEVKSLSGQQNLQQRIKHHARIKEENNSLRIQNNELNARLRRVELLNTRISEELAKYRAAHGKPSALNIEEEQRLRTMLQETEQQRDQEAQKLATLSSRVMNAAGMTDRGTETDPATALEAIEKMKHHLKSTLQELEDVKLKTRISEERQRLNELRTAHSPLRGMDAQSVTPR